MQDIASNIPKTFWYLLTQRRNFIPLLSIYFLSIPNTTANQIGIFMWVGALLGFALEIPSGYLADRLWYKPVMILAKISTIFSTLSFIAGGWFHQYSFTLFTLGAIWLTLSFSLTSGTISAFVHDTLSHLKQEKSFTKIFSKMRGNVSLASIAFILIFPFFTTFNILVPFYIALCIDLIGLFIAFSLVDVPKEEGNQKSAQPIWKIIKDAYHIHLIPFALFTGAISWIDMGLSPFRSIYLEYLGFPIIFIGTVMALSRLVWFLVGHVAHLIQEYTSFYWFLLLKMCVNVGALFMIIIFQDPYVVGIILAIVNWFWWWVSGISRDYTFKYYLTDKRYKATIVSVTSQISWIFQIIVTFIMGYIISSYSYELGYFIAAISMWAILLLCFPFIKIKQK